MDRTEGDHIEWWEERSAILEFAGGLTRESAERRAYWEWRRVFPGVTAPKKLTRWNRHKKSILNESSDD